MFGIKKFIKGVLSIPSRLDSLEREHHVIYNEIGRIYSAIESEKSCKGDCGSCGTHSAKDIADRSVSDVIEKFSEIKAKIDRIKDVAAAIAPIMSKSTE